MTEFFQNIYAWLAANSNKIVAFLTSANFLAMLTLVVNTVRTIKTNKGVAITSTDLKNELTESSKNRNVIASIKGVSETIKDVTEATKAAIDETKALLDKELLTVTNKVNAMLEVQSLVYSTIRDDSLRQTVSNLLNTARYSDANTKEQLQSEIDSLKKALNDKMEEVNQTMSDAIDKVQTVVATPVEQNNTPTRY
nr:MAG TPA: hypothetical protein [Caudoviricetes sp.]